MLTPTLAGGDRHVAAMEMPRSVPFRGAGIVRTGHCTTGPRGGIQRRDSLGGDPPGYRGRTRPISSSATYLVLGSTHRPWQRTRRITRTTRTRQPKRTKEPGLGIQKKLLGSNRHSSTADKVRPVVTVLERVNDDLDDGSVGLVIRFNADAGVDVNPSETTRVGDTCRGQKALGPQPATEARLQEQPPPPGTKGGRLYWLRRALSGQSIH